MPTGHDMMAKKQQSTRLSHPLVTLVHAYTLMLLNGTKGQTCDTNACSMIDSVQGRQQLHESACKSPAATAVSMYRRKKKSDRSGTVSSSCMPLTQTETSASASKINVCCVFLFSSFPRSAQQQSTKTTKRYSFL